MRCPIHQWLLSRTLAADKPLPPRLRRHLARCRPCRQYRRRLHALQNRLREELPHEGTLPEALVGRILLAAAAADHAPQPQASPRPRRTIPLPRVRPWAAGLAAAACVALAAATYLFRPTSPPTERDPSARAARPATRNAPVPPAEALVPPAEALVRPLWSGVRQLAAAPLEEEMRRLAAETRQMGSSLLAPLPLGLLQPAADQPPPPPRDEPRPPGAGPPPPEQAPVPGDPTRPRQPAGAVPVGSWRWMFLVG